MTIVTSNIEKMDDFVYNVSSAVTVFTRETGFFNSCVFQLAGTFVGGVIVEGSNDNVNWFTLTTWDIRSTNQGLTTASIGTTGIYAFLSISAYVRLRVSSYTSGTISITGFFSTEEMEIAPRAAVSAYPYTTADNGQTVAASVATASTNAISIKGAQGTLYSGYLFNFSATDKFVKFYNKATAPVPGTDTPVITVKVPAGSGVPIDWAGAVGHKFTLGIGMAVTGLAALLDATPTVAGDVSWSVGFV